MALKGNLRDFSVIQLLNLINLAQKTGALKVEGAHETVFIWFKEGKLAYAHIQGQPSDLGAVLYRAGKITAAQYRMIQARAAQMSDKELGLLLINANYLSQQEILAALAEHYVNILNLLFAWPQGIFQFENDQPPPAGKITLKVDLENIIIENTRKMKEWEHLKDEIPNLDMALKFTERPGVNMRNFNLSANEWRVINYVSPRNTMRQIAKAAKLNELDLRRIVYGLLQAGLVEIVRPVGMPAMQMPQAAQIPMTQPSAAEKRSLVNRLIQRIRSL